MEKDREAFEASPICKERCASLGRRGNDEYISDRTHDMWLGWQAALAYARQNGEVCLSCGTHSMDRRCDCTRLGSSELRRPAICVTPDTGRGALAEHEGEG